MRRTLSLILLACVTFFCCVQANETYQTDAKAIYDWVYKKLHSGNGSVEEHIKADGTPCVSCSVFYFCLHPTPNGSTHYLSIRYKKSSLHQPYTK